MRDYTELSKSVHCCVDCEESQCEICPRGDTPFSYIECKRKLSDDAADAIEELLDELTTIRKQLPRWISVEERLPKNELETYWVYTSVGSQHSCRWTNNRFGLGVSDKWGWSIFDIQQYTVVTHWMPLPEPPKGVE